MPLPHEGPLEGYHPTIGGSAGKGTHGGTAVNRPEGMPARNDATHIVSTPQGLVDAVTTDDAVVYIDATITLREQQNIQLGDNVTIVGGFCDPNIPGRGPVIELDYYNRLLFKSTNSRPPTLWGVSLRGPNSDLEYFDPREQEGTEPADWYSAGIHCADPKSNGQFKAVGCEFWGWTVAGIELGASNPLRETDADVIRCTFHGNLMETLGYGIEQYNGHLWCDKSFYDRCRHGISGFGYRVESWELTESVVGPNDWAGHAMDMHDLGSNVSDSPYGEFDPNMGGHHVHVRDCSFKITQDLAGYGQEAITQRGVAYDGDEVWGCDFWHPNQPTEPGDQGEAYRQETPSQRDSFENFNPHDNAFGGPNNGFGAPRASTSTTLSGEVGTVNTDQGGPNLWHTVSLNTSYQNPVVVMKPVSFQGGQPVHVRLRNVGSSSFEFRFEEWDSLGGGHVSEHASYMVFEAGTHQTSNGVQVVAGEIPSDHTFNSISFGSNFNNRPVVLTQSQTYNGNQAIDTRNRNVSAGGFDLRLQEQESLDDGHKTESVGYIALEQGTVDLFDDEFEVRRTSNSINSDWSQVTFQTSRSGTPTFLADIQTYNGGNPCGLRYRNLSQNSVDLRVQEERSADEETNHTDEAAGYIVSDTGRTIR